MSKKIDFWNYKWKYGLQTGKFIKMNFNIENVSLYLFLM